MNRDSCPTCGSGEPAIRGRRYDTRRPGRMMIQAGSQRHTRFYSSSGVGRPRPLRAGRSSWKVAEGPGRVSQHRNYVVYECANRWHLRPHDPANPHTSVYDGSHCPLPGHEAPARSVDTLPATDRKTRAERRVRKHRARQGRDRR